MVLVASVAVVGIVSSFDWVDSSGIVAVVANSD